MKVKEVSDRLGCSPATVRNWSKEFAVYLSEEATPAAGGVRQYGGDDLRILAAVGEYKNQGLTYEQIHQRFDAGDIPEIPDIAPEETSLVPLSLLQSYVVQVERLHRELQEKEREIGYLQAKLETRKGWLERLLARRKTT